jgi:Tol biopolymer transport system component
MRKLLILALVLAVGTMISAGSVRAQPSDRKVVNFEGISFELPGGDWTSSGVERGQVPQITFTRKPGAGRLQSIAVWPVVFPPTIQSRSQQEHSSAYFAIERNKPRYEGRWEGFIEGTREIAGRRFPIMSFHVSTPNQQMSIDGLFVLYFPEDYDARLKFYAFMWLDGHPSDQPSTGLEVLDTIMSSVKITSPSLACADERTTRPILFFDIDESTSQYVTSAVYSDGCQLKTLVRAMGATWSPDGKWYAYVADIGAGKVLTLGSLDRDEKAVFTTGRDEGIYIDPMWAPDSRRLAFIKVQVRQSGPWLNTLVIIDTSSGKVLHQYGISEQTMHLPNPSSPPGRFRWSPDGRNILVSWENAIVIDAETGRTETISSEPIIAEWTPDSNGVYYFTIEHKLGTQALGEFYLKNLGSTNLSRVLDEKRIQAMGLTLSPLVHGRMALSPSGNQLAVALGSINGSLLQIYSLESGALSTLEPSKSIESPAPIMAVAWAPDEQSIAAMTMGDTIDVRILDLTSGAWRTVATVIETSRLRLVDRLESSVLSWAQ